MDNVFSVATLYLAFKYPPGTEPADPADQWTISEAQDYMYSKADPMMKLGIDKFLPSSAGNSLEMWESPMDWSVLIQELQWASQEWGVKAIRVYLSPLLMDYPNFLNNLEMFLKVCHGYSIQPVLVLLDSTMNPYPSTATEPIEGVYNSQWIQSPGREILEDTEEFQRVVQPYITTILTKFGNDRRLLAIDLWNDPFQTNDYTYGHLGDRVPSTQSFFGTDMPADEKISQVEVLLPMVWEWARAVGPLEVPLTMNMGGDGADSAAAGFQSMISHSDVLMVPKWYDGINGTRKQLNVSKLENALGRPVFVMQGMARDEGVDLASSLQEFPDNWMFVEGFAAGNSQLQYPVSTWNVDVLSNSWHSFLMMANGSAYAASEIMQVRDMISSEAAEMAEAFSEDETVLYFIIIPICILIFLILLYCFYDTMWRSGGVKAPANRRRVNVFAPPKPPRSAFLSTCQYSAVKAHGEVDKAALEKTIQKKFPFLSAAMPPSSKPSDATMVPALVDASGLRASISFADMHKQIKSVGDWLHKQGVGCGDRVAVVLSLHRPEFALCVLAVSNWASCVVVSAEQSSEGLEKDLMKSGAKLVIGIADGVGSDEDESAKKKKKGEASGPFGFIPFFGQSLSGATEAEIAKSLKLPFAALTPSTTDAGLFTIEMVGEESELSEELVVLNVEGKKKYVPKESGFADEALVLIIEDESKSKVLKSYTMGQVMMASATIGLTWNLTGKDVAFNMRMESIVHQVFAPLLSGGGIVCGEPKYFWPLLEKRQKDFTWYCADATTQEQILEMALDHDDINNTLRLIAIPAHDFAPFLGRELNSTFGAHIVLAFGIEEYLKNSLRGDSPEPTRSEAI